MSRTGLPRGATSAVSCGDGADQPVRMDAALRQTVALLELVGQEEVLLGWLEDCVAQLRAVRRARQTLLDLTDVELAEAKEAADQGVPGASSTTGPLEQRGASSSGGAERDSGGSAS